MPINPSQLLPELVEAQSRAGIADDQDDPGLVNIKPLAQTVAREHDVGVGSTMSGSVVASFAVQRVIQSRDVEQVRRSALEKRRVDPKAVVDNHRLGVKSFGTCDRRLADRQARLARDILIPCVNELESMIALDPMVPREDLLGAAIRMAVDRRNPRPLAEVNNLIRLCQCDRQPNKPRRPAVTAVDHVLPAVPHGRRQIHPTRELLHSLRPVRLEHALVKGRTQSLLRQLRLHFLACHL